MIDAQGVHLQLCRFRLRRDKSARQPPSARHSIVEWSARPGEVPFRKGTAGPGFQVLLEANGFLFRAKFDRHDERPRTMIGGVTTRPVVVPVETRVDIIRDTNVVPRRIAVTSKDVDDTLFDSLHHRIRSEFRAAARSLESRHRPAQVRDCGGRARGGEKQDLRRRVRLRVPAVASGADEELTVTQTA